MQIHTSEHYKQDYFAHEFLKDFELEDLWRFPVELSKDQDLSIFQNQMRIAMEQLEQKGAAGFLFKLRFFLGRVFGWDKEMENKEQLKSGSLRERYAQKKELSPAEMPDLGNGDFLPVYSLEEESLSEIENATVHAGLHLARVPLGEERYGIQMAIYVKPKGAFGRFYMALIKPFRHAVVYPAFMKMMEKRWKKYGSQ